MMSSIQTRPTGPPVHRRRALVVTGIVALLLLGTGALPIPVTAKGGAASRTASGQAPTRFSAAQLADPAFYPERGFWDIKGVTRFADAPDQAAALATMGIGRTDTSWAQFEPVERTAPCPAGYDTYDGHCFKPPADVDERIRLFTEAGRPMMAIVFATPAWARGTRPCVPYNAWSDVFCVPDDPADAARFAGYLAHRYDGREGRGRLTDFVIQNEVNLNQWFNTGCGAGVPCDLESWLDDYAEIYNRSYDAIRAEQPNAKVMISLTQHFGTELDRPNDTHPMYSVKTFLPLLVPRLGDRAWSLALHPYPRSVTPTIDARDLPYATMGNPGVVVGWLRATYPDVPSAWDVEFTEQGLNNPGIFDAEQAASLCQAFRGVLGTPGVKSFIYHRLHDALGEFGLYLGLLGADGRIKPAYETWLHANDPTAPTCGFENAGTTVIRTGVDPGSGATWTSSRPLPAGTTMQPRQWRLAYDEAPGTVMAYECGDGNLDATPPTYPTSTWLSLAVDCDGATPMGPVGWIRTAPDVGTEAVTTCVSAGSPRTVAGTCPSGATARPLGWAVGEDVPDDVLAEANTPTTTTTTLPVDVDDPDLDAYDVVFTLRSGTFDIGAAGTVALPDGDPEGEGRTYLVGSWDRGNGALDLHLLVPSFTASVSTPILPDPVPVSFTMTQVGSGIGSLDPATGVLRLDIVINTRLSSPDPLFAGFLGPNCVMGPAALTLRSVEPFDLTTPEPEAVITDAGFAFPAAHGCGNNGDLDQVLNPALELPTTATNATMRFAVTRGGPTTTTTTTAAPASSTTILWPTSTLPPSTMPGTTTPGSVDTTTTTGPVSTVVTGSSTTTPGRPSTVPGTTVPPTTVPERPGTTVVPSTTARPGATATTATATTGTGPPPSAGAGGPAAAAANDPVARPARPVPQQPTYTG